MSVSVKELQKRIDERKQCKMDFFAVEMNLRADLVIAYGYPIEQVAKMSDNEVYTTLEQLDPDYEEEPADHIIQCRKCGRDVELKNFTDNPKYGRGCGWDYECKCGNTGFVWEGAFDED